MSISPKSASPSPSKQPNYWRTFITTLFTSSSLLTQCWFSQPTLAQTEQYCRFDASAIAQKDQLRQAALKGDVTAQNSYKALLKQHGDILNQCRNKTWPKTQAIWLRLYPCDTTPGSVDRVLDHIVNKGYNEIYVEVFYDSQVLLPANSNPTVWDSAIRNAKNPNADLLAEAIKKGHERGIKVYAWLFTMNFGYTYAQRPDRQNVLARNGRGENSLSFVHDGNQAFVDPYNRQAQIDYYRLIQEVVKRQPDGVLFDYIRYPRGSGSDSVASSVKDLWIYSPASQEALYNRAENYQGLALIKRYVEKGSISSQDLQDAKSAFPNEDTPRWQGRNVNATSLQQIQLDLWYLTVAHAAQGVLDFLALASIPAQRQRIPTGTVFFPDANQVVGQMGFDSRLQAWDRFPSNIEWHPMSYAVCGSPSCIVDQVRRVRDMSQSPTQIIPALAGYWGKTVDNRPSLEAQMQAIHQAFPQIQSVSHFAYSWQEPELDKQRRFCNNS